MADACFTLRFSLFQNNHVHFEAEGISPDALLGLDRVWREAIGLLGAGLAGPP